jgi:hypothetical protein
LISPVVADAKALTVTDKSSYETADAFLFKIRQARKKVVDRIEPIKKPLNDAKAAVMALEHELDDPLAEAERTIKTKMAAWQVEDRRRVEAENRRRWEEEQKAQRLADEQRRREEQAKLDEALAARRAQEARTLEARQKAIQEAEEARQRSLAAQQAAYTLQSHADTLAERPVEEVVKAVGSRVTEKVKWRVKDEHQFFLAVMRGEIPELTIAINEEVMEEYWKQDRMMVMGWAGVESYVDTRVAGR